MPLDWFILMANLVQKKIFTKNKKALLNKYKNRPIIVIIKIRIFDYE
jgi:hypothetical protein